MINCAVAFTVACTVAFGVIFSIAFSVAFRIEIRAFGSHFIEKGVKKRGWDVWRRICECEDRRASTPAIPPSQYSQY